MTEIRVEQRIAAAPATVYRYLTESEKWVLWQSESAQLDARPGGIFLLEMENGMRARGQFTQLIADKRVEFTWGWIDRPGIPPGSTTVVIDLIEEEGGTLVVLTHRDLPEDEVSSHLEGWKLHLPRLARLLDGPGPIAPGTG